jgi:hypothetical protein
MTYVRIIAYPFKTLSEIASKYRLDDYYKLFSAVDCAAFPTNPATGVPAPADVAVVAPWV